MATETVVLDKIDKQILSILQTDGRISWQLLGDRVHLSANAVAERVRRMTRAGVIVGFKAEVNQAALGRTLEAVIDARMPHTQGFDDAVMKRDDVLWAAHVTGESDVTLAVALGNFLSADDSPWELLMATGLVYALPPAAIYYTFKRYMVSGLTTGAVKS